MNKDDLDFIRTYAPRIALCGGIGAEIWRPKGGFEDSIRAIQILEKLGYPATGFTEQTQSWTFRNAWPLMPYAREVPDYEAFYDTFSLIAAAGPQTKTIRFTSTTDCYRRPPSVMAQTLLTLDHITKGRIGILVGTGENKQFVPHGLERTLPRNERLEEYIRIVKALLRANEPVTIEGKFWPQKDALIAVPPYNPAAPPQVWMVGGGPAAMRIAGRVADGLGSYLPGGYANKLEAFEADLAIMREEANRHGRDGKAIPVAAPLCCVLCENDSQITTALDSPYVRGAVMNLTPTGEHWKKWGSQHPLGDHYALSTTHRATNFTQSELLAAFAKVTETDIQQMIYVGTPEDVAKRFAPWVRVAGMKQVPMGMGTNFGTAVFMEHRELAEDGLPRWYHLQLRFNREINRLIGAAVTA